MINLTYNLKTRAAIFITVLITTSLGIRASAESAYNQLPKLDIYNIELNSLENYHIIKKGTPIELITLNNISAKNNSENNNINFYIPNNENLNFQATGSILQQTPGKRFSKYSSVKLSTNKLVLNDGQEVYLSASSPLIKSAHPPHTNPSTINLARTITNLSLASSPATLGASLGISFLANGLLSASQNGPSDFIWGGLSGIGLSFIERALRKQPELHLSSGTSIPFTLNEDLKISKGIQKEEIKHLDISNEEALSMIQKLIDRGDLAGALELSLKTNQEEIYNEIMKKIAS